MRVGIVLPHLLKFGGVRRFLGVGNELVRRGHEVDLLSLDRRPLTWMEFQGNIVHDVWKSFNHDVYLGGDPPTLLKLSDKLPKKNTYVWVIAGGMYLEQYQKLYDMKFRFLLNNARFLLNFKNSDLLIGGVDTGMFYRTRKLVVGYYKGRGSTKGEAEIEEQLRDVPDLEIRPLCGIMDDNVLREYYNGLDYFVVWEQREGWSNTAAEALACGCPVVSNGVNTEAFLPQTIFVNSLTEFFTDPMGDFSWGDVTDKLLGVWKQHGL